MVSVGCSVLGSLCMDAGLSLGVTHGLEGTLVEKHAGTMAQGALESGGAVGIGVRAQGHDYSGIPWCSV